MADMQIAMRLSLADLASAPLAQFMEKLQGLTALADKVSASFKKLGTGATSFGRSASAAGQGTVKLTETLSTLAQRLGGLEAKLGAVVESFTLLGRSAVTSAAGMRAGMRAMEGATLAAGRFQSKIGDVSSSLKGMAELWAAFKIEHGLTKSFEAASDMQSQMAQMRLAGFSQDQAEFARATANRLAQQNPQVSNLDAMEAYRALTLGTGQDNEKLITDVLPRLLQNAVAVQFVTHGSIRDIVTNMATLAEVRGLTGSSAGFMQASDLATRIVEASQGRMDLAKQEQVLRQYKYGGAQLATDEGVTSAMAFGEQLTTAGPGGGGSRGVSQAGTAMTQVLKTLIGGRINKVTFELLEQMGMIDSGSAVGKTTTTSLNSLIKIKGSQQGIRDPFGWLQDVLAPAMVAYVEKHPKMYGDISTEAGLQEALARLSIQLFGPTGGVNVGNLAFTAANPQTAGRIAAMRERTAQSAAGQQAQDVVTQTAAANVTAFHAALQTLETNFGATFLPMVTDAIKLFTELLKFLNELTTAWPKMASVIATAASALGLFLGVKGFTALVGKLGTVAEWFGIVGKAAKDAAVANEAAAVATNASWATAASGVIATLARMAAAFVATFTLGYIVRNVEVAGKSIQSYLEELLLSLAGMFDWFLTRVHTGFAKVMASAYNMGADFYDFPGMRWASKIQRKIAEHFSNEEKQAVQGYQSRDQARADMFAYEEEHPTLEKGATDYIHEMLVKLGILSPDAPPRAPNGADDPQLDALKKLLAQANKPNGAPAGMPSASSGGGSGRRRGRADTDAQDAQQAAKDDLQKQALKELQDNAKELKEALAALHADDKDSPDAILRKFAQFAAIAKRNGMGDAAAQLQALGEKKANEAGYDTQMEALRKLQEQLRAQEELIAARVKVGSLTKSQGENQDIALQLQMAPGMERVAEAAQKYADALKDPTLIANLQTQIEKIKDMGHQMSELQKSIEDTFQHGFESFFQNLMLGKQSWKKMLAELNNEILSGINQAISKQLSEQLTSMLFGNNNQTGQAGAQGGTVGGGILSWFSSLFGNVGSAQTQGAPQQGGGMGGIGSIFSTIFSGVGNFLGSLFGIPSFDVGSNYIPHDMVAQIHKGEMIIPAGAADAVRGGGLGGHTINLSINAMDSQSVLGAMDGVKRELAMMLGTASANYNLR